MTVRPSVFSLALSLMAPLACTSANASPRDSGNPPPNVVIRYDGKIYEHTEVKSISPKGIVVKHDSGELTIPLDKAPGSIATPFKKEIQQALSKLEQENQTKAAAAAKKRADEEKANEQREQKKLKDEQANEEKRRYAEMSRAFATSQEELRRKEMAAAKQKEAEIERELSEKRAIYPGYEILNICVIQVLDDGLLVDKMHSSGVKSGTHIYLTPKIKGAYDGATYRVPAYPDDVYSFGSIIGARRTVQKWVRVLE